MSFRTWHIYGYGVNISALEKISVEKVVKLVQSAPRLAVPFNEWLSQRGNSVLELEDLLDFDEDLYLGLPTILKEVILELEGLELTACNDFEDRTYLLYEKTYPWQMSDMETKLTEETLQSIFVKYISKITDEQITVEYYDPENGS